ncbi:MAG: alpha/beta hydrolase [Planctomycetota bacterium]|jgi:esterase/lipase superfamily enzyme
MLFITNRAINEDKKTVPGRKISFDINDNLSGQDVFFCERKGKDKYIELGNEQFFKKLKSSKAKQILIFIHGYSNLPEPHVFPRSSMLQTLFDDKEKGLVKVIPMIWPCDNDFGALKDYWDDQRAADASAFAFSRVFGKFMEWREKGENIEDPCMKRINVLAHSMGNRVLRESVKAWAKYDRNYNLPIIFRNSFLAAADVVNETLEPGKDGNLITQCSRNVTVYHASDDLALRASKITNIKNLIASRRLGHTGPENPKKMPKNVYSADCDDVNTIYDFPAGHSYFLNDEKESKKSKKIISGVVFNHIFNSIRTGRVKDGPQGSKNIILTETTEI